MAAYHHYAFHPENVDADRIADVWRFCLRAIGGEEAPARRRAMRRRRS